MRPYLCISSAPADGAAAERLTRDLTRCGFRYELIDDSLPRAKREALLAECSCGLMLTSPAAERGAVVSGVAADIRFLLSQGRPVVCLSLEDNGLDHRMCVPAGPADEMSGRAAELIPYSGIGTGDPAQTAMFIHTLYIRRLCRLTDCFSVTHCVDDVYGRAIRQAVNAWAGSGDAAYALAGLYESGTGVPGLESEAVFWIETAASREHIDGMLRLAAYRLDGIGGVRAPEEALALYRRVSAAGDARGLYGQGLCALCGFGMLRDSAEAARLFAQAAEDRNADVRAAARFRLGLLRQAGSGTRQDFWGAAWDLYRAADALTGYRPPVRVFNAPEADPEAVFPLFTRRPVSLSDGKKPVYRVVSLRSMTEQKLLSLLAAKGVYPKRPRSVMAVCRYRRSSCPEAAWLALSPDPASDAAAVSLDSRFSRMTYDASMAAYALGVLLEERHRRTTAGPSADPASAALSDSRLDYPPMPAAGRCPSGIDALRWYRLAAAHGHSGAMYRLGSCCRSGFGVPRDPALAIRLYERAAALGDRDACFALGVCCECGDGIPQDGAAAAAWYERSAKAGCVPAMNNLGGCYERGFGVEKDLSAAVEWYARAAKLGQPEAVYRLGLCAETGRGMSRDVSRAAELYRQAADAGNPYAAYRLGLFNELGISVEPHFSLSTRLYEKAARAGVPDAAYAMGLCARSGRGCLRDDHRAFQWFRAGAGRFVQAAYEAGCCLYEGIGVIRDYDEAVICFRQAADLWAGLPSSNEADGPVPPDGLTAAQAGGNALYMLGYCALYGIGTSSGPDIRLCASYLKQASQQGHAAADTLLGDLYAWGELHAEAAEAAPEAPAENKPAEVSSAGENPAGDDPVDDKPAEDAPAEGGPATDAAAPDAPAGKPCCASFDLYPNPWKTAAPSDHAAAVECYLHAISNAIGNAGGHAAGAPDTNDRLCRQGRADALFSLALERSARADELWAAGDVKAAKEADASCREYLWEAYKVGDEARDSASLLLAGTLYRLRDPEAEDYEERLSIISGLLSHIRPASPAYACASLIRAEFLLKQLYTDESGGQPAPSCQQAANLCIRAVCWPRRILLGADELDPDADTYTDPVRPTDPGSRTDYVWAVPDSDTEIDFEQTAQVDSVDLSVTAAAPAAVGPALSLFRLKQREDGEAAVIGQVKADALYRLAVLSSTQRWALQTPAPSGTHETQGRTVCFEYLARAILAGHEAAADDFARMLADKPVEEENRPARRQTLFGSTKASSTSDQREPADMMRRFYSAGCPVPVPFVIGASDVSGRDDPVVTSSMRATAMNYLGDCLYFGQYLTADRAAAVTCFRAAADAKPSSDDPDCSAIVWARYSLGCCLIRGIGCPANPREGVARLTAAAGTHAVAAYTLAECFEKGIGVDPGDYRFREAVKYYRHSMALGFRPAEDRLKAMEKQLT
ncbi:MAG: SEL1-like repeat protein [Clostridia bacterium]|nr:SEL1-like repeat protein [Clostridia bacterium]